MCLFVTSKIPEELKEGKHEGWKVVLVPQSGLFDTFRFVYFLVHENNNVWLHADEVKKRNFLYLLSMVGQEYQPGFHIFLKEEDAIDWLGALGKTLAEAIAPIGYVPKIIKVKFRKVVAFGKQITKYTNDCSFQLGDCVVAKEMYVPSEKKE